MDIESLITVVEEWRAAHPDQGIAIAVGAPHAELISQDNESVDMIIGSNGREFPQSPVLRLIRS